MYYFNLITIKYKIIHKYVYIHIEEVSVPRQRLKFNAARDSTDINSHEICATKEGRLVFGPGSSVPHQRLAVNQVS